MRFLKRHNKIIYDNREQIQDICNMVINNNEILIKIDELIGISLLDEYHHVLMVKAKHNMYVGFGPDELHNHMIFLTILKIRHAIEDAYNGVV